MTHRTWSSVRGALKSIRIDAYWSADTYTDWLAFDLSRQAHAALCRELRDLAARIREVPRG